MRRSRPAATGPEPQSAIGAHAGQDRIAIRQKTAATTGPSWPSVRQFPGRSRNPRLRSRPSASPGRHVVHRHRGPHSRRTQRYDEHVLVAAIGERERMNGAVGRPLADRRPARGGEKTARPDELPRRHRAAVRSGCSTGSLLFDRDGDEAVAQADGDAIAIEREAGDGSVSSVKYGRTRVASSPRPAAAIFGAVQISWPSGVNAMADTGLMSASNVSSTSPVIAVPQAHASFEISAGEEAFARTDASALSAAPCSGRSRTQPAALAV